MIFFFDKVHSEFSFKDKIYVCSDKNRRKTA